jgi:hypothetical protein
MLKNVIALDLFGEEEQFEVPQELNGISPEVAKEVMQEEGLLESEKAPKEEEKEVSPSEAQKPKETKEPEPPGETEEEVKPGDSIPIERFRQVYAEAKKAKELTAELSRLKAEIAQVKQYQPLQMPQPSQQTQQPTQMPQQDEEKEAMLQAAEVIDEAAKGRALQSIGITPEKLAEIEFSEDAEDAKLLRRYRAVHGIEVAKMTSDYSQMVAEAKRQVTAQQEMLSDAMRELNATGEKLQKTVDAGDFAKFSADFAAKLSPSQRHVLNTSHARLFGGQGQPTVQDVVNYQIFLAEAQAAYVNRPAVQNKPPDKPVKIVGQFPKSSQVSGVGSSYVDVDLRALEEKLDTDEALTPRERALLGLPG